MKIIDAPIELLIPISTQVSREEVIKYRNMSTTPPEILVLKYKHKYLIGDGHSRACVAYLRDSLVVKAIVIRSFVSFSKYKNHGALSHTLSIRNFIKHYENYWRKSLEEKGVSSIADLIKVNGLEDLKEQPGTKTLDSKCKLDTY